MTSTATTQTAQKMTDDNENDDNDDDNHGSISGHGSVETIGTHYASVPIRQQS